MLAADARYAMPPLPQWYAGREAIRAFLTAGPLADRWRFVPTRANGQLAFGTYLWVDGAWTWGGLDVLTLRGGEVAEVVSFLDGKYAEMFGLPMILATPQGWTGMSTETDTDQIRTLIERWADAVHRGDMAGVLADHAEDIVMFDVPPPQQGVRGIDAYRETWPGFFDWQASGASFDVLSLDVTAGDGVAFAYALLRCGRRPTRIPTYGCGSRSACGRRTGAGWSRTSTTRSRTSRTRRPDRRPPTCGRDYAARVAEPVVLSGVHAVKHAVRFGARLDRVVSADPGAALRVLAAVAPDVTVDVERVSVEEVVRLAGAPAELVGLARRPDSVPAGDGPAILLDNPRHLGNLGAVVRVAAGFGARAVLTTGTVDPWHPTVVRAAAGLHYAVPVRRITELPDAVVGFDPAGDDLRTIRLPADAVLAFGSERHGLSDQVRARATRLVAIPIRDRVSSYNLATSVAIALYAWTAAGGG